MINSEKLARMQLIKEIRKAKKRRDALTMFSTMIPVIFWAMHPVAGVIAAAAPIIVWRTVNKDICDLYNTGEDQ